MPRENELESGFVPAMSENREVDFGMVHDYYCSNPLFVSPEIRGSKNARRDQNPRDRAFYDIAVNTIDSFQGQQKDMIILSCVRTKRIGFLSDRQRLNVALTRAKRCLLVVGNFQALKNDEFWGAMLSDAKRRNCLIEANPNDRIAPGLIFSKYFAKVSNPRAKIPSTSSKPFCRRT